MTRVETLEAVLVVLGLVSGTCTFFARALPQRWRVTVALRTLGYDLAGFVEAITNPELREFLRSFSKDQFESMLEGVLPLSEKQRALLEKLLGRMKR